MCEYGCRLQWRSDVKVLLHGFSRSIKSKMQNGKMVEDFTI